MKYSTKVRYGLAVVVVLAQKNEITALSTIASQLGLSKTYLEQVLFLLKSHQIVDSVKGPNGGYKLMDIENLNAYTLFSALDNSLTDTQHEHCLDDLKLDLLLYNEVYLPINNTVNEKLKSIMIKDLVKIEQVEMYYI